MSVADAAWLAGFFDGEGSICSSMAGRNRKHPTWILAIPNTHLASLDHCVAITGAGKIYKKYAATPKWSAQWTWQVQRQRNIASILEQIRPYLVTKRGKADEFLSQWSDVKTAA
jgi:hypothetical protein